LLPPRGFTRTMMALQQQLLLQVCLLLLLG
jgi:hypothetical protein